MTPPLIDADFINLLIAQLTTSYKVLTLMTPLSACHRLHFPFLPLNFQFYHGLLLDDNHIYPRH